MSTSEVLKRVYQYLDGTWFSYEACMLWVLAWNQIVYLYTFHYIYPEVADTSPPFITGHADETRRTKILQQTPTFRKSVSGDVSEQYI